MTVKHAGTTEIKVPPGTYKDAIQITAEALKGKGEGIDDWKVDFSLAPGVGLVRMALSLGKDTHSTLELTEFKEGK